MDGVIGLGSRFRVLRAFSSHAFTLLWSGQTISALGDGAYITALAWQVLVLTNSATAMGAVVIAQLLPMLFFLLFGGVAADRLPQRLIMLASDGGRAILVLAVALLSWLQLLQLWHLIVAALLFGIVRGFFYPAYQAVLPRLAPQDHLPSVNALSSFSRQINMIIGPPLAALLIALSGPALVFAFDSLTFVLSALCLLALRLPPQQTSAQSSEAVDEETGQKNSSHAGQIFRDVKEGLGYVVGTPWLWISILVAAFSNIGLAGVLEVAVPKLVYTVLGTGVWLLGVLEVFYAGGRMAGTFLVAQIQLRRRGLLLYIAMLGSNSAFLLLGLPFSHALAPFTSGIAMAGAGLGIGMFDVLWTLLLQELVPREMLGRVSSIDMLGSLGLLPLGLAVIGVLSDQIGVNSVFLLTGACNIVLALLALCVREIRQLK